MTKIRPGSIVVLGAADGSLTTYRTAARLGYRTIAVDWSASAPAVPLADEYLPLSTRDVPALVDALGGRRDIAGIVAPSSDIALPTQRALAGALGLPVPMSELAVRASVDKAVVRDLLGELGMPSCRWIGGDDPVALALRARDLRFPVVVKPADAQGGRGVARCAGPDEVDRAVWEAKRYSYGGRLMVEEEVEGVHCSCECVVDDGRVAFMALTRIELSPRPMTLTMAHVMPGGLTDGVTAEIRSSLDRLCARLGYRRGPLNADVVVTPDGVPYVIELGLRTGGNGLDELVRHCYGVDPVRAALLAAVGAPADLAPHPPRPVTWRVLTAPHAGELVSISGTEAVAAMPEVGELVVLARPGQRVRPYLEVSDRLGWVVLRADTSAALDDAARVVAATLRVDVALVDEPEPVRAITLPVRTTTESVGHP